MPILLNDNQNVTVAIVLDDEFNNVVTGAAADAGSVTATLTDGTELSAVVSADQTNVLVTALGPITAPDTLTVAATFNGSPLTPGVEVVTVQPSAPTQVSLVPGTPVDN